MTEAMWIELIRVLPTLIWLGFAIVALVVARRILTRESHRMTRVETPFVSVELAQEVIEQAGHRRKEHPDALPTGPSPYPWLPAQRTGHPDGGLGGAVHDRPPATAPHGAPSSTGGDEPDRDASETETETETDAEPGGETPPQPVYPPVPPQRRYPVPSDPYPSTTEPPGTVPEVPPYRSRSLLPDRDADAQRGLRAATRLSLSTDLLQGGSILWVDDHHEWNEPLVRLFRTAGIKIDTVDSTDEAMRAMTVAPYDLVISDMRRDGEPAGEAAGMVLLDRMVAAGIPTPAIFFTASASAAVHPRAVTATNIPEELVNHVIDIVGRRRQYGEAAPLRLPWGQR